MTNQIRWCVACNGIVYVSNWVSRSEAYDWAARNLTLEFSIHQVIAVPSI